MSQQDVFERNQEQQSQHRSQRRSEFRSIQRPKSQLNTQQIGSQEWKDYLTPTSSASIPFLGMIQFQKIFVIVYVALEVLSLAYKYNRLIYPYYAITTQLITICAFLLSQPFRFYFANKGIQNNSPDLLQTYIIISVLSLLCYIFFLRLQLYVTFVEVILNSVGLGFTVIQIAIGIWVFVVLFQKKRII